MPIENSIEGSVSVTLDLLAREADSIQIAGEALLPIRHSLIAAGPMALDEIDTVITHPQVPGQCSEFLRAELAGARILPSTSTAEAVRIVVRGAGVRGRRRSDLGLRRAYTARRSCGRASRTARTTKRGSFGWPARVRVPDPPLRDMDGGSWKTSLVFWGQGPGRPGWLVRCLDEFAKREIDLTKIESRPRPGRMGIYMFFADLAGRASEPRVAEAIAGVAALCDRACVLGSYRAAG